MVELGHALHRAAGRLRSEASESVAIHPTGRGIRRPLTRLDGRPDRNRHDHAWCSANGSLFDGHRYAGAGAVVVGDGRTGVAAVATPADGRGPGRPGPRVVDLAGGLLAPGFVDAHVHPVQGGLERIRCDLSERRDPRGLPRHDRARTPTPTPTALDPRRRLGDGGLPGGTPTAADLDARRARPAGVPAQPRPPRRLGQHPGAGARRDRPPRRPTRPTAGSSATPTAARPAPCTRARCTLVARLLPPDDTGEDYYAGAARRARPTCTRSASPAGRTRSSAPTPAWTTRPDVPRRGRRDGDLTADVVGALWWDRDAGRRAGRRRWSSGAGGYAARPVPRHQRQDHAGRRRRELHGRAAAPYLDRCGHADRQHRPLVRRPRRAAGVRRRAATPRASRCTCTPSATAACARRWTRSRRPADVGRGDLRHHIAHLQLVHPDDVPRFAELGVAANMQALWACLDDQMVDLTMPFLGAERARWQYPFGDLHRAGARLVAGSDWPVSTPDPLAAIHVAVNRRRTARTGRPAASRSCPSRRSTWRPRSRRTPPARPG